MNWQALPFVTGAAGARMGLAPIAVAQWLPLSISAQERARKARLLEDHPHLAAGRCGGDPALTDAAAIAISSAEDQLEVMVGALHPVPSATAQSELPLARAALAIPDDLCLMMRDGPGQPYRLVSACVCSPSYWSLPQMLGRSLTALHGAIPDMTEPLQARMRHFFDALPADAVFERRNWSVHGSGERWQPAPAPAQEDLSTLWLRSERQTLRRLADHVVCFTIRVELAPIEALERQERVRAALARVVAGLSGPTLAAFGGPRKQARLLQVLGSL
ncbi:MAG: heme-dependent oxidative N-demethylase subunit alpha family protein [Pseudomonadota bacterium]